MLHDTHDEALLAAQRTVLETLADCNTRQKRALDAGDLDMLNHVSELRMQTVRDAALMLPPHVMWDPALRELVAQIKDRSASLQAQIEDCLHVVQRELSALTQHQQVVGYIAHGAPRKRATWQA